MGILDERKYFPDCRHNELCDEDYYNKDKVFGHFADDGAAYIINRRDTPRPWLQFLCNDKIESCVSNTGVGFLKHISGEMITKYWEKKGNYLVRLPNGERKLFVSVNGAAQKNFFTDSQDYSMEVRPGTVTYRGTLDGITLELLMFVPESIPCECWNIRFYSDKSASVVLTAAIDLGFYMPGIEPSPIRTQTNNTDNIITSTERGITALFTAQSPDSSNVSPYTQVLPNGSDGCLAELSVTKAFKVHCGTDCKWIVVSAACTEENDRENVLRCLDGDTNQSELEKLKSKWDAIIKRNFCTIPDKNLEYFVNYWLKNNLWLTYRYDRAERFIGYRDSLQDAWGYCLVDPDKAREKMLITLGHMMTDGRCPRRFSRFGLKNDMDDFSDSPTWAPEAINTYIRETGDFDILNRELPFLESEETSSVEDHIFRSLDYMYHSRGKNGLIRMRKGDWLDGLSGINQYGEDATSAWVTVAAFNAQNIMAGLYERLGMKDKAELMRTRSAEYKEIFNRVAWDGHWFTYAFFEDGEPIGSSKNLEGKIYLNVQTWAIFTGIVDDKDRIESIRKSIYRYLQTPFGPLLNYPPYVLYGERCGRLYRQFPGTFANSAVYNHGAAFKVFADVKEGDFEEALDTISRALPNHPDNSDMCRTSEPYAVGNVYYGPNHRRFGMNLFSWFTATPAWLLHGAFEQILGVYSDYDGLTLTPHTVSEWTEYSVRKLYRKTVYNITFKRDSAEKGLWLDGVKQSGSTVISDKPECNVIVKF